MKPETKRHDPKLAPLCRSLAKLARVAAGATHAVLINANMTRVTLPDLPRGGTLLVIRFPAAGITRDEPPLQELLGEKQPPMTYHIHAQGDTLGNAERLDGETPAYITRRPEDRQPKEGQP
jgi:hypothetical protein